MARKSDRLAKLAKLDKLNKNEKLALEGWIEEKSAEKEGPTTREKQLQRELDEIRLENHRLSKLVGLVEDYHDGASEPPDWLKPRKKYQRNAGTACFALSDLHLDEIVDPSELRGLNAYNRTIAEMRLKRWSEKAIEMGERYKHVWDGAWLAWNGDMVSGSIHEELRETNEDVLPATLAYWAPLLAAAIKPLVDYYGKLYLSGTVGNHGRLTKEKSVKRRGRNSWDWLLLQMVKAHFKDDSRITWDIASGSFLFVPIYNTHVFQSHGDEAGGGSGWSGVWTPLQTIHRRGMELGQSYGITPKYSVIGHWHSTVQAYPRGLSCNGSMKGYDEYASFLRLKPEEAMQNFSIHTPEYGVTVSCPLFLQDKKREGW